MYKELPKEKQRIKAYLNKYLNKKDTYSDEEYVYQTKKCAQIIGVAPEVTGEEIFLYMIDRTNISKEEMQEFNEKFINNLDVSLQAIPYFLSVSAVSS